MKLIFLSLALAAFAVFQEPVLAQNANWQDKLKAEANQKLLDLNLSQNPAWISITNSKEYKTLAHKEGVTINKFMRLQLRKALLADCYKLRYRGPDEKNLVPVGGLFSVIFDAYILLLLEEISSNDLLSTCLEDGKLLLTNMRKLNVSSELLQSLKQGCAGGKKDEQACVLVPVIQFDGLFNFCAHSSGLMPGRPFDGLKYVDQLQSCLKQELLAFRQFVRWTDKYAQKPGAGTYAVNICYPSLVAYVPRDLLNVFASFGLNYENIDGLAETREGVSFVKLHECARREFLEYFKRK